MRIHRKLIVSGAVLLYAYFFQIPVYAQVRIVALGDSQIEGFGVMPSESYPAQLEKALRGKGYDVTVSNAGVNGGTTQGMLNRLDVAVPPGTQIVIVSCGGNDLKTASAGKVVPNLMELVRKLRARKIEVILFRLMGWGAESVIDDKVAAEFSREGALVIPAMQDGISTNRKMHVEDSPFFAHGTGWHLNGAGYAVVVSRTLPVVEEVIGRFKK